MTAFFSPPDVDLPDPILPRTAEVQDDFGRKKKKDRRSGLAQLMETNVMGDEWALNQAASLG